MEFVVYKTIDPIFGNEYSILKSGEEGEGRPVFSGTLKECKQFIKDRTIEEWGTY